VEAVLPFPDRLRPLAPGVSLRRFPAPYTAMLAIANDIDGVSVTAFRELHRFLNTRGQTSMGRGVGLDVADSMWFFGPDALTSELSQFAYYLDLSGERRSPFAEELMHYARVGWIDTLHGVGNFSRVADPALRFRRRHAELAASALAAEGIRLPVWSNHGDAYNIQNIGPRDYMAGDRPGHPAYHSDLVRDGGAEFFWSAEEPAGFGAATLLAPLELRDGSRVWGFPRHCYASYEDALQHGMRPVAAEQMRTQRVRAVLWHPQLLHVQLSEERLRELAATRSLAIVAQHLCPPGRPLIRLGGPAVDALRRLAGSQARGEILVARTERLLAYNRARDHVRCEVSRREGTTIIDIQSIDDPVLGPFTPEIDHVRGLTFYLEDGGPGELRLCGRRLSKSLVCATAPDGLGPALGVAWFKPDHTDHTAPFTAAGSRRARAPIDPAARVLAFLDDELAGGPDPERAAVLLEARRAYHRQLRAWRAITGGLTFRDAEALELGCATGPWSIAFALGGLRVVGLDRQPAYLAVARQIAARLRLSKRASFFAGRAEQLPFDDERFDLVWAHALVPYLSDAEAAIGEAARVLAPGGYLYCGHVSRTARVAALAQALERGRDADVRRAIELLVGERLYRAGLPRNRWSNLRSPSIGDLLTVADAYGLAFVDEPAIHETQGSFHGQPLAYDFFARKTSPTGAAAAAMTEAPLDAAAVEHLELLLQSGAPRIVAKILAGHLGDVRDDPGLRRLRLRALVKAGLTTDPAAAELEPGEDQPSALALLHAARGNPEDAVEVLASAIADGGESAFLHGIMLVELGRLDAAREVFEDGAPPVDAALGILAVEHASRGAEGAQEVFGGLLESLADEDGRDSADRAHRRPFAASWPR
jgi:SAM-dependent methyltransferase